jgi:HPt (histidine-containing phosphotransfer) domain-containing protein
MSDKFSVTVDAQIAGLLPRFLANREADVTRISGALEQEDFEAIRAAGHGMKGSGGAYGFAEISRLGAALEECAERRDAAAIAALVANLADYLGRIEVKFSDAP